MGTLYGIVFFSHQLGGFLGVWLGGLFYDLYGSIVDDGTFKALIPINTSIIDIGGHFVFLKFLIFDHNGASDSLRFSHIEINEHPMKNENYSSKYFQVLTP